MKEKLRDNETGRVNSDKWKTLEEDIWKLVKPENLVEAIRNLREIKKYKLEIDMLIESNEVIEAKVDHFPKEILINTEFQIGGVLVLKDKNEYSIVPNDDLARRFVSISTNLDSPFYGEKYQDIPQAKKARFKISNLKFISEDEELLLKFIAENEVVAYLKLRLYNE